MKLAVAICGSVIGAAVIAAMMVAFVAYAAQAPKAYGSAVAKRHLQACVAGQLERVEGCYEDAYKQATR